MKVTEKLKLIRNSMQEHAVDALIVFQADPHLSEYLPEYWQERSWASGFTGSAGFLVISKNEAALWTDGRYYVQADEELKSSENQITLMKDGEPETPNYLDWIKKSVEPNATIATNSLLCSHTEWEKIQEFCAKNKLNSKSVDCIKPNWKDRPVLVFHLIKLHSTQFAGISVKNKLNRIRNKMEHYHADVHILTALDDIAWTFNLRGNDVLYNPVFLSFAMVEKESCSLFIDLNQVSEEVKLYCQDNEISVKSYHTFFDEISLIQSKKVLIAANCNEAIHTVLQRNELIIAPPPGNLMKACKNDTEITGTEIAMQRDGIAMVKFLFWLIHEGKYQDLTEFQIAEKLHEIRAEGEHFMGDSFGSIIGYQGNGAIVHYSPSQTSSVRVNPEGSILVDSGGQYLEGTTDITRIIALGDTSQEFKTDASLVLKGMIQLSMVKFPKGTRGVQLDSWARMPLWKAGKDYAHGTGHGVGCFLNVHEGPQNLRKELNPQILLPGMILSNEPGFYVQDKYGIRHENLVVVVEDEIPGFLSFKTLTICPFLVDILLPELFTNEEIEWLNSYHAWVREKLTGNFTPEVEDWLIKVTSPISLSK